MWTRRLRRYAGVIIGLSASVDLCALIAAIGCVCLFVVYIGYERGPMELMHMIHMFRVIQAVFAVKVLFDLIFEFKSTVRNTKIIKWIVDVSLLITLVPLVYPCPENPWISWLAAILYSNKFWIGVIVAYAIVDISYALIRLMGKRTNPSLILSASFFVFILIGSFLLMMPRCTYHSIGYVDSLFVSTSAVCITGLTTIDIPSTFTPLGVLILGCLIQLGGLGIMTFTSFFALFFSGNTTIYNQLMIKDMIYTKSINALIPTLLYIFGFTIVIELIGAVFFFLSIHDIIDVPVEEQIVISLFHSMSAFCNAGFSNINGGLANPILMNSNQSVYWVVSFIVIAGSIGFPVLVNFKDAFSEYIRRLFGMIKGRRLARRPIHLYNLNTKVALLTTLVIFIVSIMLFWLFERNNTLAGMSLYDQITQSVFNSTTPRSSGFMSVNPANFLNVTLVFVMFLMWIGGSSQSTAGGIKVNTFAAICLNLRAIIFGRNRVVAFNRVVALGSIRRANAVVALSILSYLAYSMILLLLEPSLPVRSLLFEVSSALFTVGSSLGITSELCDLSKILLCTAMFLGRVGIISLLIGVTGNRHDAPVSFPEDNLIIN